GRSPLRLPRLQGTDHGAAEHSAAFVALAARSLCPLPCADLGALSPRRVADRGAVRGGRGATRLWLPHARRTALHLVPDCPDLHRHRPSAAPRQPDAASVVARAYLEPVGPPGR